MVIAIVDDNASITFLLEKYLMSAGHKKLAKFENAEDFLGEYKNVKQSEKPELELVLMDVMLPGIDGLEAVSLLKQNELYQDVPVLAVTAEQSDETIERAFKSGCVDYISKPLNRIELLARVNSALDLKRAMDSVKEKNKQLKRTLSEKETLLKEIHHRVKNNLQVICSLLRLQKFEIEDEASPRVLEAFETSRRRVISMSEVHNQIYQTDHLAGVDPESYLRDLTNAIIETCDILLEPSVKVDVHPDVNLEIDEAIHTGLILNELISNAIEHAVDESGERLEITIEMSRENDKYCLRVADNGCGLEPDFDIAETSSLGLQLVQSLAVDQLEGELNINVDDGTEFEICFPA